MSDRDVFIVPLGLPALVAYPFFPKAAFVGFVLAALLAHAPSIAAKEADAQ